MQTSAHPHEAPDMFADEPAGPHEGGPLLEFQGILLRNAEVRSKPARDGLHTVPVVYMELKSTTSATARSYHAEQPFTDATRPQAEALAKSLTKGRMVTIITPIADMRVSFPHINSISFTRESQEHSAP